MAEYIHIIGMERRLDGSFRFMIEDFVGNFVAEGSSSHQTTAELVEQVVGVIGKVVETRISSTQNEFGSEVTGWIESLELGTPKDFLFSANEVRRAVARRTPGLGRDNFLQSLYLAGFITREQRMRNQTISSS